MTQTEPAVRQDGRCVVCDKLIDTTPRPGVPPLLYVDPFCSSLCAKAYYDVPIAPKESTGKRGYVTKESEGAASK